MAKYFPGYGEGYTSVHDNRPRENPSMREISNTEGYLRGCSTHAVQRNTLLIVYAFAQKNSAMELQELQTWGRVLVPIPGKILGHGTGILVNRKLLFKI